MEAFYLKMGREIKLLFEQLTQKSSIEKETRKLQDWERILLCIHKGKTVASAFTQSFHLHCSGWRETKKMATGEKKGLPEIII